MAYVRTYDAFGAPASATTDFLSIVSELLMHFLNTCAFVLSIALVKSTTGVAQMGWQNWVGTNEVAQLGTTLVAQVGWHNWGGTNGVAQLGVAQLSLQLVGSQPTVATTGGLSVNLGT